jgi:RNA polymerase sigma-70 factor (ECF subfamily)
MAVTEKTIKQCKKKNKKAQRKIYEEFAPVVYAISLRYLKDKDKAKDNLNETFFNVFDKIHQYTGAGSFAGWIKRIAVNNALMHFRERKKEIISDNFDYLEDTASIQKDKEELDPKNVRQVIERAEFSREEMLNLVRNLPDGFRAVFNLHAVEQFKHKEIAQQLNISEGTSKSQFMRARLRLQKILYEAALKKIKK